MSDPDDTAPAFDEGMGGTSDTAVLERDDDDPFDDEWVASSQRRSRLRSVLLVALAMSIVFLAGAQVQRHYGATSTSSAATTAAGGLPAGFPGGAGGFPGGAGALGGAAPGGTTAQGGTGAGTSTTATTPAVIGTVVSIKGDVWVVKDLGGKTHRVTVAASAPITRAQTLTAKQVKPGSSVTVSGSEDSGGSVTASQVQVR